MTGSTSRYRENGWWRDQTFLDDLRRSAAAQPDKPAIIGVRTDSAGGEQTRMVSYAELAATTGAFASALTELGVERGDVVAVQLPNGWEIAALGLACAQVGARVCLLMPIYRRFELEHILRRTGARVCITVPESGGVRLAETVADLATALPCLKHVIVAEAGRALPPGTLSFEEYFGTDRAATPDGKPQPDEPFLILFTSGTTGESKGVVHSQNTLYSGCRAYAGPVGIDAASVMYISHTASHYTGFVCGLLLPIMLGATALVRDVWDPDAFLDLARKHGVTSFYGAPSFLAELIAAQRAAPREVGRLRSMVTGSSPVAPHLVEQAREVFGARVTALWGMTETGATTVTRPEDPDDWAAHSDGYPVDSMQIRIDPVPGAAEGSGLLRVRGANLCLGYYGRDDLFAAALDADGWFDTGDLVRDDGRGGIRITGRVKDLVMRHSLNVPVTDIEGLLARHPDVGEVAIIGVPDGVDEMVCAVVVPAARTPELGELRAHLADAGVSDWFWPDRLEVVDVLPKTVMGKVRKAELRERFGGS